MRKLTDKFLIDGVPMLAPDNDMSMSFEDIDSEESGRDQSGTMHRFVVRFGVGKWQFSYAILTEAEFAYMEGLFAGKATFQFTCPSLTNSAESVTFTAYRSKYGITWRSLKSGECRNYNFSIVQC